MVGVNSSEIQAWAVQEEIDSSHSQRGNRGRVGRAHPVCSLSTLLLRVDFCVRDMLTQVERQGVDTFVGGQNNLRATGPLQM